MRREQLIVRKHEQLGHDPDRLEAAHPADATDMLDDDIGDDLLRLVFTACHPVLPIESRVALTLRMIATTRLALPTVNIAATTALQTLAADGLVQGLRHGANVVMPQATPLRVRQQYTLYDGKACLDDSAAQVCIQIHAAGRRILRDAWGDRAKA